MRSLHLVLCVALSTTAWISSAHAGDELEEDFEFDDGGGIKTGTSTGPASDGDDPEFDDPTLDVPALEEGDPEDSRPAPVAAAGTAGQATRGLGVDTIGKKILADNYTIRVVSTDMGSVVVELPVLVSQSPDDVGTEEYWLVGEVLVDGKKVAETRALINPTAVAELGPSVVWLKAFAPVNNPGGQVSFKVSKALGTAAPTALFTRVGAYKL
jgi:hypothetical protein